MIDAANGIETSTADERSDKQQVRMRVHDREMLTFYTNAFRSNASADEVFLDFGINMVANRSGKRSGEADGREVQFDVSNRLVMNYATAKRLAMVLGRMLRDHEQRFGEVELDVNERARRAAADADA